MAKSKQHTAFPALLLKWYQRHFRQMPWVGETDPYKIWLSEILLQQTRVEQGTRYYLRFVEAFPNVHALAGADEQAVLKLWEGLGYYSRARNLHAAAKLVVKRWDGIFPDSLVELIALPGVGPYTARAIASYAFHAPVAVVDGNVNRIIARVFDYRAPVDLPAGKLFVQQQADACLGKNDSAVFNQAMMDFGSLVCKPALPDCPNCPVQSLCLSFASGHQLDLPLKKEKAPRRVRHFHYLVFMSKRKILIRKRVAKDIWQGLYDFPLVETDEECTWSFLRTEFKARGIPDKFLKAKATPKARFEQVLTHRLVKADFYLIDCTKEEAFQLPGSTWVSFSNSKSFPYPAVVNRFLAELDYL